MLLNAEIKDDHFNDLPRQQEAQYAPATNKYLKADASTGQSYIDLNAAARSYSGPWLMGKQQCQASANDITIDWHQSCLIPAGIADGVVMRGNVIYQNPNGTYRLSDDEFEGCLRTSSNVRYFQGQTQHTYHAPNLPFGQVKLNGELLTPLTTTLPYNPMIAIRQQAEANSPPQQNYNGGASGYQPPSASGYQPPSASGYQPPSASGYRPPSAEASGYSPPQPRTATYAPYQTAPAYQPSQSYQPAGVFAQQATATPTYNQVAADQEPDAGF